jgi:hypothetical protein
LYHSLDFFSKKSSQTVPAFQHKLWAFLNPSEFRSFPNCFPPSYELLESADCLFPTRPGIPSEQYSLPESSKTEACLPSSIPPLKSRVPAGC